jgi:arsenical pump membrane protein
VTASAPIWIISAAATAGVIVRPFAWPEWIWAVTGAVALVAFGLLPASDALHGVRNGTDVYLFLTGMMLLAELARHAGLFDWLAAHAARHARGSARQLFTMVYIVGTIVTIFLSNDATAVVLTPAVAAVARAAGATDALPYLLICAFVANAASFVLPISNPANLVVYGSHMPPLMHWLPHYAVPSILAIVATYTALRWTQRTHLRNDFPNRPEMPHLSAEGRMAACGIVAASIVMLAASAFDISLGLPAFLAGAGTAILVLARSPAALRGIVTHISWGVLPLVAGLFVMVDAVEKTGVAGALARLLQAFSHQAAVWVSGTIVALACNVLNNLPAALLSGRVSELARAPEHVRQAVLIGIDLGPNLSVTGSLATILWLAVLRREGYAISAWRFLKLGAVVMPISLILALGSEAVLF